MLHRFLLTALFISGFVQADSNSSLDQKSEVDRTALIAELRQMFSQERWSKNLAVKRFLDEAGYEITFSEEEKNQINTEEYDSHLNILLNHFSAMRNSQKWQENSLLKQIVPTDSESKQAQAEFEKWKQIQLAELPANERKNFLMQEAANKAYIEHCLKFKC